MDKKPSLRFDHREIAVLFSLFVFVSLLMFTVGILVGKGLTQARYEGRLGGTTQHAQTSPHTVGEHPGGSVSLGTPARSTGSAPEFAEAETAPELAPSQPSAQAPTPPVSDPSQAGSLKLIPLRPTQAQRAGTELAAPMAQAAEDLLKDPKIASLVEPDDLTPASANRSPSASTPVGESKGKFTVQIGSYPDETAARERVEALKKMGFPHAFFSAKELGSTTGTWYRVWAGHFPDYQSAKQTGDQLQARGEVRNYIVRKNN